MRYFNKLTPAQLEQLAILSEELGEAQQAIGKILRHGYDSTHPDGGPTNRWHLEGELGDVIFAIEMLCDANEVDRCAISEATERKSLKIQQYLHHN